MILSLRRRLFAVAGLWLVVSGCKGVQLPKTYPATGSVQYADGRPMKGGLVQFMPVDAESAGTLRVSGVIKEDGTFALETVKDKHKLTGAPEGEYRVSIIPPLHGEHKGLPPIELPGTTKVEAKENEIPLKLPPPSG
jgi:hypothetical protein